ncbi:hypothetical protein B7463_g968, partial [Scytalidium lignicola]
MATTFDASTPSPPSSIRTPSTPKHGWEDNYQPYSPRKSARVTAQRLRRAQTPPPVSEQRDDAVRSSSRLSKKATAMTPRKPHHSPPSSPQTAAKKSSPKHSSTMAGRKVSGALDSDSAATAAASLGLSTHDLFKMDHHRSSILRNGMLPTPAKTPKRRPTEASASITSIARNLFPTRTETTEEVMPSPKKRKSKRYTGFTLDSFEVDEEDAPITIYTDSQDRVPEVDLSAANPFYGEGSAPQPEPTKRASKRRKNIATGEEQLEEETREDGLVYVFRGKKIFRKFADEDDTGSPSREEGSDREMETALDATVPAELRRPLTRSSIKPKLLFPTAQQLRAREMRSRAIEEEEEAATDIEEFDDVNVTPSDHIDTTVMTPKAPKFAPASPPPTTARVTRSNKHFDKDNTPPVDASDDDDAPSTPLRRNRGGKISPFDSWQRTKGGAKKQTNKRAGEPLTRSGGDASKRVVNDDGPPSNQSSPYVHSLVKQLQGAGHIVSVVLPNVQRSWIGKAHIIGQTVKPTYFRPGTLHKDDGTTHSRPLPAGAKQQEEWVLVDGTPASCVQIGLYHYFQNRGPVDLVVSGPNYGRNSTAVFGLSSGTLGGALEAAVCKKKAIAISYAFFSRNHDPVIIAGASSLGVKIIEHLYNNWGQDVDLYSINIPLVEDVVNRKILWTKMLQNYWEPGSCFQEVEDDEGNAADDEERIREGESPEDGKDAADITRHKHKHFKWAPRFTDVYRSVDNAPPGNDGWAVKEGYTSVTPLKANFMHAAAATEGELKLPSDPLPSLEGLSLSGNGSPHFYASVNYEDDYVQPLILSAMNTRLPPNSFSMIKSRSDLPDPKSQYLQVGAYEALDFEYSMSNPSTALVNSYIIRKALIRKHYLGTTAYNWTTKYPNSVLASHIKPSCDFELDYAEFLDEALVEAWELQSSFQNNEDKEPSEREWLILKPGMSDRGQGIRLFSTEEELRSIFEEWEYARSDSEDEDEEDGALEKPAEETMEAESSLKRHQGDYIVTSHLRHFVAQSYIHPPFLIPDNPRKFHIRTYVLAVGSLKVYVYREMLALFASKPYIPPWEVALAGSPDLLSHLTNTCLQNGQHDGSVQEFWDLALPAATKDDIFDQICKVTGEIFEAAAKGMMIHFQTLPNAFEVFGLDYLVDADGIAWLLEVNAFPDFKQTGDELKTLVAGLWEGVVDKAIAPFFGIERNNSEEDKMVLVKEQDLGR